MKFPHTAAEMAEKILQEYKKSFNQEEAINKYISGWEKTSFGAITEYRNGSEVLTRFTHPLEEFNPEISRHTAVQLPFPKNLLNQWEVLWTCTKESYSNEYTSYIFETYQKLTDIETRIKNGEDLFWAELVFLFNPKEELIDLKNNIAGIFSEWKGRTSLFSRTLEVHFQTIQFNQEGHLVIQTEKVWIPFYAGRKSFSKLPIRKITPEEKAQLSERGSLFNRFLDGSYYEYDGNMLVSNGFQPRSFRATGKVIIDCVGLATFKPYIAERLFQSSYEDTKLNLIPDTTSRGIPSDMWWMTPPHLCGFSFHLKQWGLVDLTRIKPVRFKPELFDRLIMPAYQKNKILHLLRGYEEHRMEAQDMISHKGTGLTFFLNGPPGRGKTLLCEVMSEVMQKPLYSVSVGELGTTPSEVEERLSEIFDLMCRWNSILLLDEADIFLEKRKQEGDSIVRNSIVGVFLKTLEYHQGIVFLTSNRAESLDPAVISRISYGISYDGDFDLKKVLVDLANEYGLSLTPKQIEQLPLNNGGQLLNGREARNIFRLAKYLAASKKRPLEFSDILEGVTDRIELNQKLNR